MDLESYIYRISTLPWGKEGYTLVGTRLLTILEELVDDARQEGHEQGMIEMEYRAAMQRSFENGWDV